MLKKKLKNKKPKETVTSAVMTALLRSDKKESARIETRWRESGAVVSSMAPAKGIKDPSECSIFRVVLITEGLGNRANMNYYGQEAIQSAPAVFEGKCCYIDHPSRSEESDRPERSAWHKVGYFKGIHVEPVNGKLGVVGELHLDMSESGRFAAAKLSTALHYQKEFPGSEEQYVGLSVNADGQTEPRDIVVEGQQEQVNYVLTFTEAASCDLVTVPARGGKVLALVESAAGAIMPTKEESAMIIKTLKAALAALKESQAAKDLEAAKKSLSEGLKQVESLLKEAEKAVVVAKAKAVEAEDAAEPDADDAKDPAADKAAEAAEMYEKGAAMMARAMAMGHKKPGEAEAEVEPKAESDLDVKVGPGTGKPMDYSGDKKKGEEAKTDEDESEAAEAKSLAIAGLLKEAKVNKEHVNFEALCKMKLSEAKAEIERTKKIRESIAKDILASLDLPAGHPAREAGSGVVASNQAIFNGLAK